MYYYIQLTKYSCQYTCPGERGLLIYGIHSPCFELHFLKLVEETRGSKNINCIILKSKKVISLTFIRDKIELPSFGTSEE